MRIPFPFPYPVQQQKEKDEKPTPPLPLQPPPTIIHNYVPKSGPPHILFPPRPFVKKRGKKKYEHYDDPRHEIGFEEEMEEGDMRPTHEYFDHREKTTVIGREQIPIPGLNIMQTGLGVGLGLPPLPMQPTSNNVFMPYQVPGADIARFPPHPPHTIQTNGRDCVKMCH